MWLNLVVDYVEPCHININLDMASRPHVVHINTKPQTSVLHNSMVRSMDFSSMLAPSSPHLFILLAPLTFSLPSLRHQPKVPNPAHMSLGFASDRFPKVFSSSMSSI
jgi:hypothetical protein